MACPGVSALNPVCQVKGVVGSVASSVFDQIARDFGQVAGDAVNWLWGQLSSATAIDLSGAGIRADLLATGAIAVVLTSILFLVQVIWSALRREPGGLLRAVSGLAVAFVGSAFAIAATKILLTLVDGLSAGVVQFAMGTNIEGLGRKLVAVQAITAVNPAGELLLALVVLAAVVTVWVALMIRKLLIIVSAVFAPVAFSGATADVTRGWVRKWIEMVVALASAKLILVVIFMVGVSVLDGAGSTGSTGAGQAITQTVIGALILLMGGLAPWLAIKMVHFAGDSFQATHAHVAAATAGAATIIAAPHKVTSLASQGQQIKGHLTKLGGSSNGGGGSKQPASTAQQPSAAGPAAIAPAAANGASAGTGAAAGAGPAGVAVAAGSAVVNGAKSATTTAAATTGQQLAQSPPQPQPPAPPPKSR
jgi:type IV secretion system protein TrbL